MCVLNSLGNHQLDSIQGECSLQYNSKTTGNKMENLYSLVKNKNHVHVFNLHNDYNHDMLSLCGRLLLRLYCSKMDMLKQNCNNVVTTFEGPFP